MGEVGILENDLRKVHAEVNQIVSQRFQLTTLAILVFAAVCGWAIRAWRVREAWV